MAIADHIVAMFRRETELDCSTAQDLMSPFIDSAVSQQEAEELETHLAVCKPCQRQLQAFVSLKNLMVRIEPARPPEDLVLETRVKLSHVRSDNRLEKYERRVTDILKPVAIPAILGVSLTMLLFGVLLGGLVSTPSVMAHDRLEAPIFALYKPVRTTGLTMLRFASSSDVQNWEDVIMVETEVGADGRVIDYEVITGPHAPEVDRWIRELLYFAEFTPATSFGKPIRSRMILSFVAVRS